MRAGGCGRACAAAGGGGLCRTPRSPRRRWRPSGRWRSCGSFISTWPRRAIAAWISDSLGRRLRRLASARSWAAARSSGWTCLREALTPHRTRSARASTASCLRSLWPLRPSCPVRFSAGEPGTAGLEFDRRSHGWPRRHSAWVRGSSASSSSGPARTAASAPATRRSPERSPPPATTWWRSSRAGSGCRPKAAERWRESYAADGVDCRVMSSGGDRSVCVPHFNARRSYAAYLWLRRLHEQRPFDVIHFPECQARTATTR